MKNTLYLNIVLMVFGYQAMLFSEQKPDVDAISLEYKLLNKKESKKVFKTKKLWKKGYQPIEITVTNHADHAIEISKDSFNIPTVSASELIAGLRKNSIVRGIVPPAVMALPVAMLAASPEVMATPAGALIIPFGFAFVASAIYGACAGVSARNFNKKITGMADLELQAQCVQPGQSVTGMIFVYKSDLNSDSTLLIESCRI